jgi:hypothetical protein
MQNLEHAHHWANSWNCSDEIGAAVYFEGMTAQQANAFVENPDKGTFERIMARAHHEAARAQSYYDAKDPYLRFRDIKHWPGETFEQFTKGTQTVSPSATASIGKQSREPSEAELRQQLADALAARKAADEKLSTAKHNLKRADDLLGDAEAEVARLEGAEQHVRERDAACAADAIRAGSPLPTLGAPEIDQAELSELSAAKAKAASIRAAREVLATEYSNAAAGAAKAAAAAEKLSPGANRLKPSLEKTGATLLWTLVWTLVTILFLLSWIGFFAF